QIALAGLLAASPAWVADRIMITVTLVGFAAATLWQRWRVSRGRGMCVPALLAALLAMNLTWVLGVSSFPLGACLFPLTLGCWWPYRDRQSPGRVAALSALLMLGYFCHLVSLGLTALGLVILSLAGSCPDRSANRWQQRLWRLVPISISFIPLAVLG